MADYNLANWARDAGPQDQQALTVELLRQKILSARQQALAQANASARQYDPLVGVAALANNPDIMQAAQGMQKAQRTRFEPEKMGQQGFMLPDSGEFVESPLYTEERQAQRAAVREGQDARIDATREGRLGRESATAETQAARLEASKERQAERLQQADALKQQQFALTGALAAAQRDQRASEGEANRALRRSLKEMDVARVGDKRAADQSAKDEKELNRQVELLGRVATERGVPRMHEAGRSLAASLVESERAGKEMPGLSMLDKTRAKMGGLLPAALAPSPEALRNISALQDVVNTLLAADSGKAVTLSEENRAMLMNMQGDFYSEKQKKQILKERVLPLLNLYRSTVLGRFKESTRAAYTSRQQGVGGDTSWMEAPLQFDQIAPDEKVISKRAK